MLTAEYQVNGSLVSLRRANKTLDGFDKALYLQKLYTLYGDAAQFSLEVFKEDSEGDIDANVKALARPDVQAALTIFGVINTFAEIAPRVTRFEGAVKWATARDSVSDIDATFRFWLGDEDLQAETQAQIKALDNPNGTRSGVLAEDEAKDPLSVQSAVFTSKNLPAAPNNRHGNDVKQPV